MTVSAFVEVRDGAGPWVDARDGVDVTPGNVVSVRLIDDSGADTWSLRCIATDDLGDGGATTTRAIVFDPVSKLATFPAPAAKGRALTLRSTSNRGKGYSDGASFDFGVYTPARNGRVHATNETIESDSSAGWGGTVNALIRNALAVDPSTGTLAIDALETSYTHPGDGDDWVERDVRIPRKRVVDDTPTPLFEHVAAPARDYYVTGFLKARSEDGSTFLIYRIEGAWSAAGDGVLAMRIAKAISVITLYESDERADVTLGVSSDGTKLQILAKGLATLPLIWRGRIYFHESGI